MSAVIIRELFGLRAAIVVPDIPDDAPADVKEGIARRAQTMLTGRCPCGARVTPPNRVQRRQMERDRAAGTGRFWSLRCEHEDGCPAVDAALLAAIARWLE